MPGKGGLFFPGPIFVEGRQVLKSRLNPQLVILVPSDVDEKTGLATNPGEFYAANLLSVETACVRHGVNSLPPDNAHTP